MALNTMVDVAVFAADRLLRARRMTLASRCTMVGVGVFLALARRDV